MEHPEEHLLELFAAGSRVSDVIDRQIRDHLAVCPHCAATVEEMRTFYADVAAEFVEDSTLESVDADTRGEAGLPARRRQIARRPPDASAPGPLVRDVRWFISDHPVFSAGIAAGLLGLLGLALFVPSHEQGAANPAYARINTSAGTIETFDASDRFLWAKPAHRIKDLRDAQDLVRPRTAVLDLNKDGTNEVVIGFKLGNPEDESVERVVSVFAADGALVTRIRDGKGIRFGGGNFQNDFGVSGLTAVQARTEPRLAIAWAHFRSPSFLAIVGPDLRTAGRFWHFGHLFAPTPIPDPRGGGGSVIACLGVNQARDSVGIQFPILVVLDPSRITGDSESGTTRGFGLPATTAEIACIRFPQPDVIMMDSDQFGVKRLQVLRDGNLKVIVGVVAWTLEYYFSAGLQPLQIKPIQGFDRYHAELRRQGKIRSVYGPAYLEELKRNILYWNGTDWQNEPTLIGRPAL